MSLSCHTSIPERSDPDDCSCPASTVIRRPAASCN